VAEPTESATEPTIEPTTEPDAEPPPDAESDSDPESPAEPDAEPVAEASADPAASEQTPVDNGAEDGGSDITPIVISNDLLGDVDFYEEMPDNTIPLMDGLFALQVDDTIWQIFNAFGLPLGYISFPPDIEINVKDWDIIFINSNLIPLSSFIFPHDTQEAGITAESVIETLTPSPKTGESPAAAIILLFASLISSAGAMAAAYKKRARKIK
jgi:hypothetical protein